MYTDPLPAGDVRRLPANLLDALRALRASKDAGDRAGRPLRRRLHQAQRAGVARAPRPDLALGAPDHAGLLMMVWPPSTTSAWPTMKPAASEHIHTTTYSRWRRHRGRASAESRAAAARHERDLPVELSLAVCSIHRSPFVSLAGARSLRQPMPVARASSSRSLSWNFTSLTEPCGSTRRWWCQ